MRRLLFVFVRKFLGPIIYRRGDFRTLDDEEWVQMINLGIVNTEYESMNEYISLKTLITYVESGLIYNTIFFLGWKVLNPSSKIV